MEIVSSTRGITKWCICCLNFATRRWSSLWL